MWSPQLRVDKEIISSQRNNRIPVFLFFGRLIFDARRWETTGCNRPQIRYFVDQITIINFLMIARIILVLCLRTVFSEVYIVLVDLYCW